MKPAPAFAVEVFDIEKKFGGVAALHGCTLQVRAGEIHALLGQNGAGKSTLVKILNGVHGFGSFRGTLSINGRPVKFHSPAQARRNGVGYVPQEIEVIENCTVAENIFTGIMADPGNCLVPWKQLRERAAELLAELGLSFDPLVLAASLSTARRHLLMIARALAAHPSVLVLDEPTASLSSAEIGNLFTVLRKLKARGTTIIYVTHRLPELFELCDRASILRDGCVAQEFARAEFDLQTLVNAMSGRRLETQFPPPHDHACGGVLLEVRDLAIVRRGRRLVRDVGFSLREGEILGLAGLLGSGRTEILDALYGRIPYEGEIRLNGKLLERHSPRHARQTGIALLTEDRKRDGLLFNLPVRGNITIGNLGLFSKAGLIRADDERLAVLNAMADLNVKADSTEATVSHLSGGNQQKLLFGRALMRAPRLLLLDEPTKGVDVAARHEIYRLVVDLAAKGMSVILVSSELEEVIGLANRCLVLSDGEIVDRFNRGEGGEERILEAIAASRRRAGVETVVA